MFLLLYKKENGLGRSIFHPGVKYLLGNIVAAMPGSHLVQAGSKTSRLHIDIIKQKKKNY